MEQKIKDIKDQYTQEITQATDLGQLDALFLKLFGKNGEITLLPKDFSGLAKEELQKVGPVFNQTKVVLEQVINKKRGEIRELGYTQLAEETFDRETKTEFLKRTGHLHPVTQFEQEILDLFAKLGFQRYDAPHIDSDFNNFEVLNIPAEHPARDLWDTLYIDESQIKSPQPGRLLMRTHTSNAQIRIMKENSLPIRMMVMDRCFRNENLDARHEHTLDQFELVYIDKKVSMANLQYLTEYFLKSIFGPEIKVQLRPKYYPFVEPGAGFYGECIFCKGKGCRICGSGWLELGGAGMIHPVVLKSGGIDPNEYSGLAWGMGPERMAMLKYGVEDIRTFKSGDLRALQKIEEHNK